MVSYAGECGHESTLLNLTGESHGSSIQRLKQFIIVKVVAEPKKDIKPTL